VAAVWRGLRMCGFADSLGQDSRLERGGSGVFTTSSKAAKCGGTQQKTMSQTDWEQRSQDQHFHRFDCAQQAGRSSTSPTSFPSENSTQLNFLPRLLP
jgi:hypothetical protein